MSSRNDPIWFRFCSILCQKWKICTWCVPGCSIKAELCGNGWRNVCHTEQWRDKTKLIRQHCLKVELSDWPLSARVCVLAVDAFSVALHLWQVLVEHFARSQSRHQIIELSSIVLPVGLCFTGLSLLFPLFFELEDKTYTYLNLIM